MERPIDRRLLTRPLASPNVSLPPFLFLKPDRRLAAHFLSFCDAGQAIAGCRLVARLDVRHIAPERPESPRPCLPVSTLSGRSKPN